MFFRIVYTTNIIYYEKVYIFVKFNFWIKGHDYERKISEEIGENNNEKKFPL